MENNQEIIDSAELNMMSAISHLETELAKIRAGKANPSMLSSIKLDYYGSTTLLSQIANINTPDAQTLSVQPWEKDKLQDIEKAIMVANLGFNPMNNGESIIINIPPLTEERRKELVKIISEISENFKVSIRNVRRKFIDQIKNLEKDKLLSIDESKKFQEDVQKSTDNAISDLDERSQLILKERWLTDDKPKVKSIERIININNTLLN